MNDKKLKEWKWFEAGKKYNGRLDPPYYDTVSTNLDFFSGNQWRNVKAYNMPTPVFNYIKRAITFFVSSLMSNKTKLKFEPLEYVEDCPTDNMLMGKHCADIANSEADNLFDKFKMDNRIRDALFDAGVMGDVAAHLYFDPNAKPYGGAFADIEGEIKFELVDGTNIYLGNANNCIISTDTQPYVIISGRDTLENLKYEAKLHKQEQSEINSITTDNNTSDMAGAFGNIEIEGDEYGKAQYIICYRYDKETETIKVSKCTENVYMYSEVDTGLNVYPVAWLLWEKQKNQYHGRAVCTGMIPNQIFINRMFAMVMYHLIMSAFPKAVYDADKVSSWNNEIGSAIPIKNLSPGDSIKNIAGYLEPGNMSNQIVQVIELAIQYTKETLGISDASLGNVKPDNYRAIVAIQESASVPLENVKANLYEWVEDVGKIMLNMMGVYYGKRPIVIKTPQGNLTEVFDFSSFRDLYLNVKCEVGPSSYWSELASVETLDNLFKQGAIDIVEYLESMPDDYIANKTELIDKIKQKLALTPQAPQQNNIPPQTPPIM